MVRARVTVMAWVRDRVMVRVRVRVRVRFRVGVRVRVRVRFRVGVRVRVRVRVRGGPWGVCVLLAKPLLGLKAQHLHDLWPSRVRVTIR